MMALTSKISDYDSRWPSMFLAEKTTDSEQLRREVAAFII